MRLYQPAGSRVWWHDFSVGNKRDRRSTGRLVKAEAPEVARARLKEGLDRHQLGALPELTLAQALGRHLASTKAQADHGKNVRRADKLLGRNGFSTYHLDPDMPLHQLSAAQVSTLVDKRRSEGMAEGTIKLELALLGRVANRARFEWGVRAPPVFRVDQPKPSAKFRWLTEEEEQRFIARFRQFVTETSELDVQRMRQDALDLSIFLLDTGARYSEAAGHTWDRTDTTRFDRLTLWRSKVGKYTTFAMTPRMTEMLTRRHADNQRHRQWVFPGRGTEGPRGHATRVIMRMLEEAGCNTPAIVRERGKATVHSLRDTYASRLLQRGMDIVSISSLLGHASITQTMKYAHLAPNEAAARAAELLAG